MEDDDYYNVDGNSGYGARGMNSGHSGRTSHSSYGGAPPATAGGRPATAASVKGAGFSSTGPKYGGHESHGQYARGAAPPLVQKSENGIEAYCKELEREVHQKLEESSFASAEGNYPLALERAKEAEKKERVLWKKRDESNDEGVREQNNAELTYAIRFNLANQYHLNRLFSDALRVYDSIVRDPKRFNQAGQLRANMGNIYFEQGAAAAQGSKAQADYYNQAIKQYRMALDNVPNSSSTMRYRIVRNIGHALVRLGKYNDAMNMYADVMQHAPDTHTGFNLVVCHYSLGGRESMKKAFAKLVQVQPAEEEGVDDDEGLGQDTLKEELRRRKNAAKHAILTAARLIAPALEKGGWEEGFDWLIDHLKKQRHEELAGELEMEKALEYLKKRDFDTAVRALKEFHRKDLPQGIKARAATNLSFLYFLESDEFDERSESKALRQEEPLAEAERYAKTAVENDRYNARALVNLGACLYRRQQVEGAKLKFQQAVDVEADCVEAIYNLGMAQKSLGQFYDALAAFSKVKAILPSAREAAFQMALCHDALGNLPGAVKALEQLNAEAGVDPSVLVRLGSIHAKANDTIKALQYYSDAHALCPANMECVTWLGAYHFHSPYLERALPFFDLAARLRPNEVKWALVAANCHRRVKNLPEALERFQKINRKHPDNIECLKNLISVCTELNLGKEAERYQQMKERLERQQPNEATTTAASAPVPAPFPAPAPAQAAPRQPAEGNWDGDAGYRSMAPARDPYGDAAGGANGGGQTARPKQKGEDEWGQEVLGDDLLPM